MPFKWVLEHSPGYAGYIVAATKKEEPGTGNHWVNKMAFKKYTDCFPEGKEVIRKKEHLPMIPSQRAGKKKTL